MFERGDVVRVSSGPHKNKTGRLTLWDGSGWHLQLEGMAKAVRMKEEHLKMVRSIKDHFWLP